MLFNCSLLIKLITLALFGLTFFSLIDCSSLLTVTREEDLDNGVVVDSSLEPGPIGVAGTGRPARPPFLRSDVDARPAQQSVKESDKSSTAGNQMRRMLSSLPGGQRLGRLSSHPTREEIEVLRKLFTSQPNRDWSQFTSPPVTEPNCYVEVQVTQKMPGKCTKLGGTIPACQAQDLITFDSACE